MNRLKLNITNEVNQLQSVILGIANSFGSEPSLENCIDPKTKYFVKKGKFPLESDCKSEIKNFNEVLVKNGVKVLRPKNIDGLNQIFTRDIGFVIENKFFISNTIKQRGKEKEGIKNYLNEVGMNNLITIPEDIKVEGGDVIVHGEFIFIGISSKGDSNLKVSRTQINAVEFIQDVFPGKRVIGLELFKSDDNPYNNILHLDCTMQPIGNNRVIIFKDGFRKSSDKKLLDEIFGEENLINITRDEMFDGCSNIFSINENVIVSDKTFKRLNDTLRGYRYVVEEVYYREISKYGGLFRCSTLPIERK